MTWRITTELLGAQKITDTDTTQRHPLLTIVDAQDETYGAGKFIYLKGVASTAIADWVGYSPTLGTSVRAVANGNYPLAVAMSACNTTTKFGWYQIYGIAVARGLTSITHTSGFLWLTATAGSVDDASVIGDAIIGARKTTTVHVVGTFTDTYMLSFPQATNHVFLSN